MDNDDETDDLQTEIDLLMLDMKLKNKQEEGIKNTIQQLKDRILQDKSIKIGAKHFAIVYHNSIDESVIAPYRELEQRIRENIGENILIVFEEEEIIGCPGLISPDVINPHNIATSRSYMLGRISGELEYDLDKDKLIIPISKLLAPNYRDFRSFWIEIEGPISFEARWMEYLGDEVPYRQIGIRNEDLFNHLNEGFMISIGDEIDQFFIFYPCQNEVQRHFR